MQEGAIALMQMAKTAEALGRLDEAGILTLSLVTDPTFGGVAASFATLADVIVVESGARLGSPVPASSRRRSARPSRRASRPPSSCWRTAWSTSCAAAANCAPSSPGCWRRAPRAGPPPAVRESRPPQTRPTARIREPERLTPRDPWHTVRAARDLGRPTTLDHLGRLVEDFEELRGDRLTGDCPAIVGGPALFEGRPVMVVGHQKGHTLAELADRNYGMANPAGYRKAARLMRLAAKLRMPVLTFVDTPGAYPGVAAEEQGQSVAIAENLRLMAGLPVPVVTVVTGEGGSGGALALAVADRVMILEDAVYSVISPEGCAAILWQDPAAARTAAEALRLDAANLLRHGIVDAVVPVPPGGAQADHAEVARNLRGALAATLRELAAVDPAELPESRRERFRRFGRPDAGGDANARAVPVRATVLGGVS
ncbi:acetyl-CoA carboxylase carboxyl transferase subunit alpha [Yinghuangia aomiensis]